MAYQGSKNPFQSEADDEFCFGGSKGSGTRNYVKDSSSSSRDGGFGGLQGTSNDELFSGGSSSSFGEPLSRSEQLQQQKQQSMNRQLDSTNRCLASIYDSEQIGVATAEELLAQGEQLDNVERKLDRILVDTKTSQRHLNGIKSIFGGIKNWWTGDAKKEEAAPPPSSKKQSEVLQKAMSTDCDPGAHPAFRLRSGDVRGFYDDDVVDYNPNDTQGFGSQRATASSRSGFEGQNAPGGGGGGGGFSSERQGGQSAEMKAYEENLNRNLDMMSGGMSRLKMLATGLGEEIEAQNDQVENRIMIKADKADIKIRDQNRQMRQILGK